MNQPSDQMPLVSVLIPAYNAQDFISETLSDILNQTYQNLQIVIIDDASTDRTNEIIQSFSDPRIHLIKNRTNLKQPRSLNRGLKVCTGKYIARIDADDRCPPDRIMKQVMAFEKNTAAGLCFTWYRILNSERISQPSTDAEQIKVLLFFKNQIGNSSVMIRKEVLDNHQIDYDENVPVAEDYLLWTKIIKKTDAIIIPEILMEYREHPGQTSALKRDLIEKYTHHVQLFQLSFLNITPDSISKDIHIRLLNNPFFDSTEMPLVLKWAGELMQANRKYSVYNIDYFESEVSNRVNLCWKRLQHTRWSDFNDYLLWRKKYQSIGIIHEIRFLFRVLIRK